LPYQWSNNEIKSMPFTSRVIPSLILLAGLCYAQVADAQRYPAGSGRGEIVLCESQDYRQFYCAADTRGGVRIVNQLSDSACVEGRNWGWDQRGVWVSDGCRAEFATGFADRGGYGRDAHRNSSAIVRCESHDFSQIYCAVDTRGGVRLIDQLSRADCVEGHSWGVDRRGIWVREGCRAEFEIGAGGGHGRRDGLPLDRPHQERRRNVYCESQDRRYRHCPTRIGRRVELVRQLSDADCSFNRSWGYDLNGIWVDRGCRGEFAIY
jgi:hypothetical protein